MTDSHLDPKYRQALLLCAWLNFGMLFIEAGLGWWIGSAALLADAVDFLEDAAIFGLAIVAINWSARARGQAGLIQGTAMAAVGLAAIIQIVWRLSEGGSPAPAPMGAVAILALAVNLFCAYRLVLFRAGDASMRAIWLSARNDAVLNMMTMVAAGIIALTHSAWPDIVAGVIIGAINLFAAADVLSAARKEMKASRTAG